jgi:drug/metabolite transporter (DMT)-like permease
LTTQQKAYIALGATSIIWGTTWVAMKLGVNKLPPLQLAYIRQCIGGLLFIAFFAAKKTPLPTKQQFKQLLVLSLFTFVFANGLSTWSLKYLPSGLGALIGALYPLCVVLIEYFFFNNKHLNALSAIGIVIGFCGIVLVLYENAFATQPQGFGYGIVLAIIAMLSWSYSTIMISRNRLSINSYYSMGWQMLMSAVIMFAMSMATGQHIPFAEIPLISWAAIAYLIVFGSITAIVAFIFTMKHLPASVASLYAYINPIVAIFVGTFFLGEHLTLQLLIGSVITLFGVYLVNRSLKKA